MILQVSALLLSGVWGFTVGGSSYMYWGSSKAALSSGIAMGVVAFFLGLLTLSFINSSELTGTVMPPHLSLLYDSR